jgi:hypothetical protein
MDSGLLAPLGPGMTSQSNLQTLPRRRRMDSERMHAAGKLARQRRIDHAMALDPALPAKGFRHDIKPEMSLAAGPVAGVTFVPMRFILDMEALGRESVAQLFRDQIAGVHGKSMIPKSMPSGFDPMGGNRFSDKIMPRTKGLPSTRCRGRSERMRTFAACQVLKVPCRDPHNCSDE